MRDVMRDELEDRAGVSHASPHNVLAAAATPLRRARARRHIDGVGQVDVLFALLLERVPRNHLPQGELASWTRECAHAAEGSARARSL